MRTLSASVTTQYATEPIIVLKIEWDSGTVFYGQRTLTWGADSVKGDIISVSNLNNISKDTKFGDVAAISAVLNDTDGSIKALSDTDILEGTPCTVYQVYVDPLTDVEVVTEDNILLRGKLSGDIVWSEGERTLSFSIESALLDGEIGYAPTSTDIPDLDSGAVGKMWPICFGKPIRVPALRLRKTLYGSLKHIVQYATPATVDIEGGIDFPQTPTVVTIFIKGIQCTGTFSGNTFTFATKNDAIYNNVDTGSRVAGDYLNDPSVLWLIDPTVNLLNKFCIINHMSGWMVNYCIKQDGTMCTFVRPWKLYHSLTFECIGAGTSTLVEVAQYPRTSWVEDFTYDAILDGYNMVGELACQMASDLWVEVRDSWTAYAGDNVKYLSSYNETYVVNNMKSTSLLEVMAYRQIKKNLEDVSKEKTLVAVPSSWYTKNLDDTINGKSCTTITFTNGLDDSYGRFSKYEFESELYVTVESNVGDNVADIIQYLIETYTTYAVDAVSFLAVHTDQVIFPCNFVLNTTKSALEVCNDIAWQARCAICVHNGIVYLKYLSKDPLSTDMTLNTDNIILKSISLGYTTIEELITYFTANWKQDYTGETNKTKTYVYKDPNSVNRFGTKKQEYDFYIYNQESLVKISADFWGYRLSHIWRKLNCTAILTALKLEVYDTATFSITTILTNDLKGDVISASYNKESPEIPLVIQLACLAGTIVEDDDYWDVGSHVAPNDPTTGLAEIDYVPIDYNEDSGASNNKQNEQASNAYFLMVTVRVGDKGCISRGDNFILSVTLVDETGKKIARSCNATLELHAQSGPDILNVLNFQLVGGYWSTSTAKITGGSGRKVCYIKAWPTGNPKKFKVGVSVTFDVVSDSGLSVTPTVATIARGVTFSVAIIGPANQSVTLSLTPGADPNDSLIMSGANPIVLDDGGNWSGSVKISGGMLDSTAVIHAEYPKYDGTLVTGTSASITINKNLQVIGGDTEGAEAAESTAFIVGTSDKGLELHIMTRVAYFTGSHILWGYIRTLKFDNMGNLYDISGETRISIDTPDNCVCP